MNEDSAPAREFSRLLRADGIGPGGIEDVVEATPGERAALAARLGIPAVRRLRCRFRLSHASGGAFEAMGRLEARVVQTCVVTLDEFEAELTENFNVRFVPAGTESDDPDPESEDELPYAGGVIDLGEAAAEQLALALDPYPHKPGAEPIEAPGIQPANPFAGLAALKRSN